MSPLHGLVSYSGDPKLGGCRHGKSRGTAYVTLRRMVSPSPVRLNNVRYNPASANCGTGASRFVPFAEAEAQWTRYLEADEGSPDAFFGQVLVMFAAWVADQELQSVKRRTKEGLERAREQGKVLGPPRKFRPNQVETMRRMREGGASLRRIAGDFECSASTVLRALRREGGVG